MHHIATSYDKIYFLEVLDDVIKDIYIYIYGYRSMGFSLVMGLLFLYCLNCYQSQYQIPSGSLHSSHSFLALWELENTKKDGCNKADGVWKCSLQ